MSHNQYQLPVEKQALGSFNKSNELDPLLPTANVLSINNDNNNRSEAVGLGLMALNAFSLSILNLFIKLIGSRIPSFQISLVSSMVETVLCLITCFTVGVKNPFGPRRLYGWLTVRGLSGALALATIFYSMTQLPLGDATVIAYLNPIFTAILAAVMLHEPFHLFEGICAVLCLAGTILVTKPGFLHFGDQPEPESSSDDDLRTLGTISGIVGAIMIAFMYVTTRKIGTSVHFLVIVVYNGIITSLVSVILLFSVQEWVRPQSFFEYSVLLFVGILQFSSHCFMGKGLQLAPAGPASVMRMVEICLAFMFGILVFHEYPDLLSVLGATIIAGTTTLLAWRKWNRNKKNRNTILRSS
ncbi:hypothetical protein INT45_012691 [Circinella minor]|uniref:EamA domain-containing protein n=1 Tax=Circinella minor TaxID=1195481 RepID=A0A8H7RU14_9FUNG|nr:hypothetical protein INT45_012691 [Circinella minor]